MILCQNQKCKLLFGQIPIVESQLKPEQRTLHSLSTAFVTLPDMCGVVTPSPICILESAELGCKLGAGVTIQHDSQLKRTYSKYIWFYAVALCPSCFQ